MQFIRSLNAWHKNPQNRRKVVIMDDLESWNANHGARYILHNSVMKKQLTFCLTFRVQRLRRREKEEFQSLNLAGRPSRYSKPFARSPFLLADSFPNSSTLFDKTRNPRYCTPCIEMAVTGGLATIFLVTKSNLNWISVPLSHPPSLFVGLSDFLFCTKWCTNESRREIIYYLCPVAHCTKFVFESYILTHYDISSHSITVICACELVRACAQTRPHTMYVYVAANIVSIWTHRSRYSVSEGTEKVINRIFPG